MAAGKADRMPFKYNGRIEGWRLCAEPQVNLAYRWVCKVGIEDNICGASGLLNRSK
jgi:hypothetical protein